MDKNKLVIPISIVVASIVIGGFYYKSEVEKQRSIERQEELKLQEDKMTEEARVEMQKKQYAADRRSDCLNIYKTENGKWNNVVGWRYSETDDKCYITYKDQKPKSDATCDELYPGIDNLTDNLLCKDGNFENSF